MYTCFDSHSRGSPLEWYTVVYRSSRALEDGRCTEGGRDRGGMSNIAYTVSRYYSYFFF